MIKFTIDDPRPQTLTILTQQH